MNRQYREIWSARGASCATEVERELRRTHRMSAEQIQLCYESAAEHAPFKLSAAISPIDEGLITQKKEGSSF